jgi:hypothetical protein
VETTAGNIFKKEGKAAKIGKMIRATVVCEDLKGVLEIITKV